MFPLLVLSLFLLSICCATSDCPPPEVVQPCKCDKISYKSEISCESEAKDLKNVFTRLSDNMKEEKRFYKLVITSNINEIETNLTKDVKFDIIKIENSNLQRIHSSAFQGTAETVKEFALESSVSNLPPPYNTFDLMNSFINAEDIYFNGLKLDKFYAIKPLPKLKGLSFIMGQQNSPIEIFDHTFCQLDNLVLLKLDKNKINYIHPKAFEFLKESEERLEISLQVNELTSLSLNNGWLNNINRPAFIWLDSNEITYLDRNVFRPFLDKHEKNVINSLHGNPLDCSDCRNAWLVKEKDKNGQSFEERIRSAYCGRHEKKLFEEKFNHCK